MSELNEWTNEQTHFKYKRINKWMNLFLVWQFNSMQR